MKAVVIVEDNVEIAEMQAIFLRDYASVEIISNHFQRCFRPDTWHGVDVAVVDLMLPGLQGEDVLRFLMHEFPLIRRVICTAKPTHMLPELRPLADVILQKPFRAEDFVAAVIVGDDGG